ncbi:MAG: hypothetical protein IJO94_01020 [Firmicutes bacterium]|nr:hypothetical protein [Bacillota bacterium]MBQ4092080.1 hypothetical protein [Bacillota bacterium]MBQ6809966.1 hypothetical protein [Bacillota bacterium]
MRKKMFRTIRVDEDALEIMFLYDDKWRTWIGQYPFFKEEPRYTPSGRPWRNAVFTECIYHKEDNYSDCGSCPHFVKHDPKDLIGVCFHEKLRQKEADRP